MTFSQSLFGIVQAFISVVFPATIKPVCKRSVTCCQVLSHCLGLLCFPSPQWAEAEDSCGMERGSRLRPRVGSQAPVQEAGTLLHRQSKPVDTAELSCNPMCKSGGSDALESFCSILFAPAEVLLAQKFMQEKGHGHY